LAIALGATWAGLFTSFYLPYPVSFFIITFVFAIYILVRLRQSLVSRTRNTTSQRIISE
jgi:zinc/manganese transport system permease protein